MGAYIIPSENASHSRLCYRLTPFATHSYIQLIWRDNLHGFIPCRLSLFPSPWGVWVAIICLISSTASRVSVPVRDVSCNIPEDIIDTNFVEFPSPWGVWVAIWYCVEDPGNTWVSVPVRGVSCNPSCMVLITCLLSGFRPREGCELQFLFIIPF